MPSETIRKYYRLNRQDIGFLRFIFEACEGIAVITTIDPEKGIVILCIPPGCESDVDMVLESMNIHIEEIRSSREFAGLQKFVNFASRQEDKEWLIQQ